MTRTGTLGAGRAAPAPARAAPHAATLAPGLAGEALGRGLQPPGKRGGGDPRAPRPRVTPARRPTSVLRCPARCPEGRQDPGRSLSPDGAVMALRGLPGAAAAGGAAPSPRAGTSGCAPAEPPPPPPPGRGRPGRGCAALPPADGAARRGDGAGVLEGVCMWSVLCC